MRLNPGFGFQYRGCPHELSPIPPSPEHASRVRTSKVHMAHADHVEAAQAKFPDLNRHFWLHIIPRVCAEVVVPGSELSIRHMQNYAVVLVSPGAEFPARA